jgi:hypothetical protein
MVEERPKQVWQRYASEGSLVLLSFGPIQRGFPSQNAILKFALWLRRL